MRSSHRRAIAPLSDPERERHGRVLRAAQAAFGAQDAVIAFLDRPHARLCRRPRDLAIDSDAGLAAVEKAILADRPWPI